MILRNNTDVIELSELTELDRIGLHMAENEVMDKLAYGDLPDKIARDSEDLEEGVFRMYGNAHVRLVNEEIEVWANSGVLKLRLGFLKASKGE